jgi:hypothetical protein
VGAGKRGEGKAKTLEELEKNERYRKRKEERLKGDRQEVGSGPVSLYVSHVVQILAIGH